MHLCLSCLWVLSNLLQALFSNFLQPKSGKGRVNLFQHNLSCNSRMVLEMLNGGRLAGSAGVKTMLVQLFHEVCYGWSTLMVSFRKILRCKDNNRWQDYMGHCPNKRTRVIVKRYKRKVIKLIYGLAFKEASKPSSATKTHSPMWRQHTGLTT